MMKKSRSVRPGELPGIPDNPLLKNMKSTA